MPIQYQRDRDGKWRAVGLASRDDLEPQQLLPGSAEGERAKGFARPVGAQATRGGRPVVWAGPDLGWQSPASFEKAKSRGQLPKPAPQQPANKRTGLSWLANELTWIGKGVANNVVDGRNRGPMAMMSPFGPVLGPVVSSLVGRQNMAAFQFGAADNILKAGEAAVQSLRGQEVNPGQNSAIRGITETGYRVMGAKLPSQQNQVEQQTDANFRSLGVNTVVGGLMAPLAPLGVGATAVGTAVRGAGLFLAEQAASTLLDDNTGGNASNLAEAVLGAAGAKVQVPGAVRPTDNWGEATTKSLIPNAVAAGMFGAAASLTAKAFGIGGRELTATRRWTRETREVSETAQARTWAQERGLIADGEQGFVNRYSPPEFIGDLKFSAERPAAATPATGAAADVAGEGVPASPDYSAGGGALDLDRPIAVPAERGGGIGLEGQGAAPAGDVALEGVRPQATANAYSRPAGPAADLPRIIGRPDVYSPVQDRLQRMDAAQNPDTAAYDQWLQGNQQVRGIPTTQMEAGGAVLPGELPRWEVETGDPWVDPADFNPVANPSLPETDQFIRDVWKLDDDQLVEAAQAQGSTVQSVQMGLGRQSAFDPAGDPRFGESAAGYSMAPGEALGLGGDDGIASYKGYLESEPWSGLRALTDPENNPAVARIIQGSTGKEAADFTRADMVEGLVAMAEREGQFVIPRSNSELYRPGEQIVPVDDLGIDPARFQFKGGVDPSTGEQLGASLDGINAWNTDLEGVVSAWRDPESGGLWTINGHNRVAAARRLGVPSLPVKVYDAPDAAAARSIGALQNIADGKGTAVDAAKFLRDNGITDVGQLQQLVPGMPLRSGWAEQGLALSRLPDDAFNAVVQGDLSAARGAIIGGSGKTPPEMSALWRYADRRGVSDRVLRELVAMTAPDATAMPDVMRQGTIWDALGQDTPDAVAFNNGLLQKAKLSDRVASLLSADRRLFDAVSRRGAAERLQAGAANKIDAAGSRAVADSASQVTRVFDRTKYQSGPIGDLLNQGVARLDAGESLDVVARDVSGAVASAMERQLGGGGDVAAAGGRITAEMPTAEELAGAEAAQLTPRKLKTREAKVQELEALPTRTKVQERMLTKARKELERHRWAEGILERQRMAEQAGPGAAQQVADELMPAEAPQPQGPTRLTPEEREQLQVALVQRAIDADELRPPSTPAPELLHGPALPLGRSLDALDNDPLVPGSDAAQAVADELRLAAEYAYRDAAVQAAAKQAEREASGYFELTGAERLTSPQFRDGFRDAPIGESLDARLAYATEQRLAAEKRGDAVLAREWREAERKLSKQQLEQAQQRQATNQQEMFGVGQYDTSTPLLNQPAVAAAGELPANPALQKLRATVEAAGSSDVGGVAWGPVTVKWEKDGTSQTLFITPVGDLKAGDLKDLGLKAAEVRGMNAARKAELLRDSIDQVRRSLPPGEYMLDAAGTTQRGAMVKALRDDPSIRWMDVNTDQPTKPGPNAYGVFTVDEASTGAPAAAAAPGGLEPRPAAINPEVLPPESGYKPGSIADQFASLMQQMAASDARMFRTIGEYTSSAKQGLDELAQMGGAAPMKPPAKAAKPKALKASANGLVPEDQVEPITPFGPLDIANREAPIPEVQFQLPPSLAKASPRYGRAELRFDSDLDRTAYMLARDSTGGASKAAQKFRRALEEAGLDPAEVARHGREKVQAAVKAAAGGGAAPQKDGLVLDIPDQGFNGSTRLPLVERTRLEAEVAHIDAQITALDAEIERLNTQATDGGCF